MRKAAGVVVAFILAAGHAHGQIPATPRPFRTADAPTAAGEEEETGQWSFSASASTYVVPDGHDYVQPTVTADRGWLHLEARYNYEAADTGSALLGYNFSGGDELEWELTPMLGAVVGDTWGIAPGCRGSLGWWMLELNTEVEYVFDASDFSRSSFTGWLELALAPLDWARLGVAAQRTQVYETERDVQPGGLVGFSYRGVDLTTYVFDPDTNDPTVVVAVGVTF